MHNQIEQEEKHPVGIIQKANEYKQKSSNTMYYISFLVGLLIIITGYIILKAVFDHVGLWAAVIIIAIFAAIFARKL